MTVILFVRDRQSEVGNQLLVIAFAIQFKYMKFKWKTLLMQFLKYCHYQNTNFQNVFDTFKNHSKFFQGNVLKFNLLGFCLIKYTTHWRKDTK